MKFIYEQCSSRKATLRVTLDAGSAVECLETWPAGIAHVTEHMMFQGTNSMNHEELTKAMGMLGVDWNGATWHAKVTFYVTASAENILEASKLLHGMLFYRKFDQKLLDKEKLVVLEEERGGRDDVEEAVAEKFNKFICDGPIAIPIIGTAKSIKSIRLEEVQAFYDQYYRPANMLVVLTGPASVDVKAIGALFGKNTDKFRKSARRRNIHNEAKKKTCVGQVQQARIFVAYKAVPISHKDALILAFMDKFFGDDMDSRLFQSLRQRYGLCYGVGGWVYVNDDIGWYVIWTKTSKENVDKSLSLIDEEVTKLMAEGPTEEEMNRAKNKYLSEIYSILETSGGTNSLVSSRNYNNLPDVEVSLERVRNMTVADVVRVCKKYLKAENRKIFTYLPK
jgi:predicted Zn-dependent peptidase